MHITAHTLVCLTFLFFFFSLYQQRYLLSLPAISFLECRSKKKTHLEFRIFPSWVAINKPSHMPDWAFISSKRDQPTKPFLHSYWRWGNSTYMTLVMKSSTGQQIWHWKHFQHKTSVWALCRVCRTDATQLFHMNVFKLEECICNLFCFLNDLCFQLEWMTLSRQWWATNKTIWCSWLCKIDTYVKPEGLNVTQTNHFLV